MRSVLMATTAFLVMAQPVLADNTAVLIGNGDYQSLPDLRSATALSEAADGLSQQGLTVIDATDASARDLANVMDRLHSIVLRDGDKIQPGRLLVLLSGRFVTSGLETWFLPVDAPEQSSLTQVSRTALPLSTVLAILATQPGHAVLGLATEEAQVQTGPFLTAGIGSFTIPQGVTVLTGPTKALARLAMDTMDTPGAPVVQDAAKLGLSVSGYAPLGFTFLPEASSVAAKPTATPPPPKDPAVSDAEKTFWDQTRTADTETAYKRYLDRYPDGAFTAEATRALTDIRSDPYRAERLAEDGLKLSQDQRREIQRDLSLLEFNTKGIDGIFGPGSRAAIVEWQRRNEAEPSGFLSATQIARLDGQAERRAAELEAEAEARRLEQERQDQAFWQETGGVGDEAGLRAYLKRYPDGVHAEDAANELARIEDAKLSKVNKDERALWDQTRRTDTREGYTAYLKAFPKGAFAAQADARLAEMDSAQAEAAQQSADAAAEAALQLPPFTMKMLEQRLEALNLNPGTVDGVFDDNTRRAIRRYQTARNLTATGYVNQPTIIRLLADAVGQ